MVQENNKHPQMLFFFVERAIYASPLYIPLFLQLNSLLCHYSLNSPVNLPRDLVKEFQSTILSKNKLLYSLQELFPLNRNFPI